MVINVSMFYTLGDVTRGTTVTRAGVSALHGAVAFAATVRSRGRFAA